MPPPKVVSYPRLQTTAKLVSASASHAEVASSFGSAGEGDRRPHQVVVIAVGGPVSSELSCKTVAELVDDGLVRRSRVFVISIDGEFNLLGTIPEAGGRGGALRQAVVVVVAACRIEIEGVVVVTEGRLGIGSSPLCRSEAA